MLPEWFLPTVGSALGLGVYDICKKHAVRDNSVMPVLFLATLTGSTVFVIATAAFGRLAEAAICSLHVWWLLLAKAVLVGASWTTVLGNPFCLAGNRHCGDFYRLLLFFGSGKTGGDCLLPI